MPKLELRDVVSAPGLLSLVRLPLAGLFLLVVDRPALAMLVLAAAGLSDVLDGRLARRSGKTSFTGALLDPAMDKIFVVAVVLSLLVAGKLSLVAALVLGARDLLELPLVLWLALDPAVLEDRRGDVKANRLGKATTVLQFATIVAALLAPSFVGVLALAAGGLGLTAAVSYWGRALQHTGTARS